MTKIRKQNVFHVSTITRKVARQTHGPCGNVPNKIKVKKSEYLVSNVNRATQTVISISPNKKFIMSKSQERNFNLLPNSLKHCFFISKNGTWAITESVYESVQVCQLTGIKQNVYQRDKLSKNHSSKLEITERSHIDKSDKNWKNSTNKNLGVETKTFADRFSDHYSIQDQNDYKNKDKEDSDDMSSCSNFDWEIAMELGKALDKETAANHSPSSISSILESNEINELLNCEIIKEEELLQGKHSVSNIMEINNSSSSTKNNKLSTDKICQNTANDDEGIPVPTLDNINMRLSDSDLKCIPNKEKNQCNLDCLQSEENKENIISLAGGSNNSTNSNTITASNLTGKNSRSTTNEVETSSPIKSQSNITQKTSAECEINDATNFKRVIGNENKQYEALFNRTKRNEDDINLLRKGYGSKNDLKNNEEEEISSTTDNKDCEDPKVWVLSDSSLESDNKLSGTKKIKNKEKTQGSDEKISRKNVKKEKSTDKIKSNINLDPKAGVFESIGSLSKIGSLVNNTNSVITTSPRSCQNKNLHSTITAQENDDVAMFEGDQERGNEQAHGIEINKDDNTWTREQHEALLNQTKSIADNRNLCEEYGNRNEKSKDGENRLSSNIYPENPTVTVFSDSALETDHKLNDKTNNRKSKENKQNSDERTSKKNARKEKHTKKIQSNFNLEPKTDQIESIDSLSNIGSLEKNTNSVISTSPRICQSKTTDRTITTHENDAVTLFESDQERGNNQQERIEIEINEDDNSWNREQQEALFNQTKGNEDDRNRCGGYGNRNEKYTDRENRLSDRIGREDPTVSVFSDSALETDNKLNDKTNKRKSKENKLSSYEKTSKTNAKKEKHMKKIQSNFNLEPKTDQFESNDSLSNIISLEKNTNSVISSSPRIFQSKTTHRTITTHENDAVTLFESDQERGNNQQDRIEIEINEDDNTWNREQQEALFNQTKGNEDDRNQCGGYGNRNEKYTDRENKLSDRIDREDPTISVFSDSTLETDNKLNDKTNKRKSKENKLSSYEKTSKTNAKKEKGTDKIKTYFNLELKTDQFESIHSLSKTGSLDINTNSVISTSSRNPQNKITHRTNTAHENNDVTMFESDQERGGNQQERSEIEINEDDNTQEQQEALFNRTKSNEDDKNQCEGYVNRNVKYTDRENRLSDNKDCEEPKESVLSDSSLESEYKLNVNTKKRKKKEKTQSSDDRASKKYAKKDKCIEKGKNIVNLEPKADQFESIDSLTEIGTLEIITNIVIYSSPKNSQNKITHRTITLHENDDVTMFAIDQEKGNKQQEENGTEINEDDNTRDQEQQEAIFYQTKSNEDNRNRCEGYGNRKVKEYNEKYKDVKNRLSDNIDCEEPKVLVFSDSSLESENTFNFKTKKRKKKEETQSNDERSSKKNTRKEKRAEKIKSNTNFERKTDQFESIDSLSKIGTIDNNTNSVTGTSPINDQNKTTYRTITTHENDNVTAFESYQGRGKEQQEANGIEINEDDKIWNREQQDELFNQTKGNEDDRNRCGGYGNRNEKYTDRQNRLPDNIDCKDPKESVLSDSSLESDNKLNIKAKKMKKKEMTQLSEKKASKNNTKKEKRLEKIQSNINFERKSELCESIGSISKTGSIKNNTNSVISTSSRNCQSKITHRTITGPENDDVTMLESDQDKRNNYQDGSEIEINEDDNMWNREQQDAISNRTKSNEDDKNLCEGYGNRNKKYTYRENTDCEDPKESVFSDSSLEPDNKFKIKTKKIKKKEKTKSCEEKASKKNAKNEKLTKQIKSNINLKRKADQCESIGSLSKIGPLDNKTNSVTSTSPRNDQNKTLYRTITAPENDDVTTFESYQGRRNEQKEANGIEIDEDDKTWNRVQEEALFNQTKINEDDRNRCAGYGNRNKKYTDRENRLSDNIVCEDPKESVLSDSSLESDYKFNVKTKKRIKKEKTQSSDEKTSKKKAKKEKCTDTIRSNINLEPKAKQFESIDNLPKTASLDNNTNSVISTSSRYFQNKITHRAITAQEKGNVTMFESYQGRRNKQQEANGIESNEDDKTWNLEQQEALFNRTKSRGDGRNRSEGYGNRTKKYTGRENTDCEDPKESVFSDSSLESDSKINVKTKIRKTIEKTHSCDEKMSKKAILERQLKLPQLWSSTPETSVGKGTIEKLGNNSMSALKKHKKYINSSDDDCSYVSFSNREGSVDSTSEETLGQEGGMDAYDELDSPRDFFNNVSVVSVKKTKSPWKSQSVLNETLDNIQTTMIASEEELDRLNHLDIVITWDLPLAHAIDTGSQKCKVQQLKDKLASLGQELKTTRFTKEEEEIIKRNWDAFSEEYNFDNPELFMPSKQLHGNMPLKQRLRFKQFLARGLPDRRLFSVYRKFIDIFSVSNRGRWTEKEDRLLLDLQRTFNEEEGEVRFGISKLVLMQKALGRNQMSVLRRLNLLHQEDRSITQKDIDWTNKLKGKLIRYLLKYSKSSLETLRYERIKLKVWKKVAEKLKLPMDRVVDHWKYYLYPQLFARQPVVKHQLYIQLIIWFYKSEITNWETIDWSEISKKTGDLGSCFLYRCFRLLVTNYVPERLHKNFVACVKCLYKNFLPHLVRKKQSLMLTRLSYNPETRMVEEIQEIREEILSFKMDYI